MEHLQRSSAEQDESLSAKHAGELPSDVADELQNYVNESRQEWGKRDI